MPFIKYLDILFKYISLLAILGVFVTPLRTNSRGVKKHIQDFEQGYNFFNISSGLEALNLGQKNCIICFIILKGLKKSFCHAVTYKIDG